VGYEVTLFAWHTPGREGLPGSDESRLHHDRLKQLLLSVVPPGEQPFCCDVEPFDGAFHLRPETQYASEIELHAVIRDRDETFARAGEPERHCVKRIEEGLRRLGARRRTWVER
jgi:hypothetical protein